MNESQTELAIDVIQSKVFKIALAGLTLFIGYTLYKCYKKHGKLTMTTIMECIFVGVASSMLDIGKNLWHDIGAPKFFKHTIPDAFKKAGKKMEKPFKEAGQKVEKEVKHDFNKVVRPISHAPKQVKHATHEMGKAAKSVGHEFAKLKHLKPTSHHHKKSSPHPPRSTPAHRAPQPKPQHHR